MRMPKFYLTLTIVVSSLTSFTATAIDSPLAPPPVEVVDERGVNIATGTLSKNIETVTIGGERGLKHSIGLYSDFWAEGDFYGFIDRYAGYASYKNISGSDKYTINQSGGQVRSFEYIPDQNYVPQSERLYVMRVYGPAGNQDFVIRNAATGSFIKNYNETPITSGYEYVAAGDPRHTLVENANKTRLEWTTPEGIVSVYEKGISQTKPATSGGRLLEVRYPNGFKLKLGHRGVSTNTGYMLKYHKNNAITRTPYEVVAFNLAEEYCSLDAGQSCSVSSEWPKASFVWPSDAPDVYKQGGLPLSRYLFKVVDGNGGVTELQYAPKDICLSHGQVVQSCADNPPNGRRWQLRLSGIKNPGSTSYNYQYSYVNTALLGHPYLSDPTYFSIPQRTGRITASTYNGKSWYYSLFTNNTQDSYYNENYGGYIAVTNSTKLPGTITKVEHAKIGTFKYSGGYWPGEGEDLRRFVKSFSPIAGGGPSKSYTYDSRGNLTKIVASGANITLAEASYPGTCTASNSKTCNSPLFVTDARGNTTYYEYDPGNRFAAPIKVTEPADADGVHKITYYTYEPRHAYYKLNGNNVVQDPDALWLLTEEHTCRSSTATTSGCGAGSIDMVKTEYYYGPQQSGIANNLHLRGKSLTAEGNGGAIETRVWCYEYDKFGNMIGETLPKGNTTNLESCP